MAKSKRIDVRGAASITLLIHGVGEHSGSNIGWHAKRGFESSSLAKDFTCEIEPTRMKSGPWIIENQLKLTRDGETHFVVPCIWSGRRIGRHASVLMIAIGILLGMVILAIVSAVFFVDWLDARSLLSLAVGAVVLDVLAMLGRPKKQKFSTPKFQWTALVILYIVSVKAVVYVYPWLWLLPALIMLGLGIYFGLPGIRCAFLARGIRWKILTLACTIGVAILLVGLGLLLGTPLRTQVPSDLRNIGYFSALLQLSTPLIICTVMGLLFYVLRVFFPLELVYDVTRYVGRPAIRNKLLSSFRRLVDSVSDQSPDSPIWIASHSLGTVVATHACLEAKPNRIGLITMGSPLAMMSAVFPGDVQSPEQLRAAYVDRGKLSFWLNLWRDGDPIGRALNAGSKPYAEHSIGKGGHSNYWKDELVWNSIVGAIRGDELPIQIQRGPESFLSTKGLLALCAGTVVIWVLASLIVFRVDLTPSYVTKIETLPLIREQGVVHGQVIFPASEKFPAGEAVADVQVVLGNHTRTVTDQGGKYWFDNVPPKSHWISVVESPELFGAGGKLFHYSSRPKYVTVSDGESVERNVVLDAIVPIQGRVVGASGRALIGEQGGDLFKINQDGTFQVKWRCKSRDCTLNIRVGGTTRTISIPRECLVFGRVYELGDVKLE